MWLDRHADQAVDVHWWLQMYVHIDASIRAHDDDRAEWSQRRLWLLREAAARGIHDPGAVAVNVSNFMVMIRQTGDPVAGLPSADEVVAECLAVIGEDPAAIPLLDANRNSAALSLEQMRRSRAARNLVNAARWHEAHLTDDAVIDALNKWTGVLDRLV